MKTYDLVIVGSGAGLNVLEHRLEAGLSCAVVECSRVSAAHHCDDQLRSRDSAGHA